MEMTETVLVPGIPTHPPLKNALPWFDGTTELDAAREEIKRALKEKKMGYAVLAVKAGIDPGGFWYFLNPNGKRGKNTSYELVARAKRALEIV